VGVQRSPSCSTLNEVLFDKISVQSSVHLFNYYLRCIKILFYGSPRINICTDRNVFRGKVVYIWISLDPANVWLILRGIVIVLFMVCVGKVSRANFGITASVGTVGQGVCKDSFLGYGPCTEVICETFCRNKHYQRLLSSKCGKNDTCECDYACSTT